MVSNNEVLQGFFRGMNNLKGSINSTLQRGEKVHLDNEVRYKAISTNTATSHLQHASYDTLDVLILNMTGNKLK